MRRMDRAGVERWIEGYLRAWRSDAPEEIAVLFTDDAVYKPYPWPRDDPGWGGREAIIEQWIAHGDSQNEWSFEHEIVAVDGDRAVVEGWTTYSAIDGQPKDLAYANLWLVRFAADGRATHFAEWWIERPREEATEAVP
jgi:ketosteroid isomerase-like protein